MKKQITESVFSDYKISTVGKIFLAGIACSLLGKKSNLKVSGTVEQIEILKRAMNDSKSFQEELDNPKATVQTIMEKLRMKNASTEDFSNAFNLPWPL